MAEGYSEISELSDVAADSAEKVESFNSFIPSENENNSSSGTGGGPGGEEVPFQRNRHLVDVDNVWNHNAWDDVEWDEETETQAKAAVQKHSVNPLTKEKRDLLEKESPNFWNRFYKKHNNRFFKDRHWLFIEFPELEKHFEDDEDSSIDAIQNSLLAKRHDEAFIGENSNFRILEIGCGAGNTVFPLLAHNKHPETFVFSCDFSHTSIEIINSHQDFDSKRCFAFHLDIAQDNLKTPFPPESMDIIILIFVISAISPEKFNKALQNVYSMLKPGGIVLFRDYGLYDLAQVRFKEGRFISKNFYARGDGTCVYFFEEDELVKLFTKNGYEKLHSYQDRRLLVNRRRRIKMYRIWLHGKFQKPKESHNSNFSDSKELELKGGGQ